MTTLAVLIAIAVALLVLPASAQKKLLDVSGRAAWAILDAIERACLEKHDKAKQIICPHCQQRGGVSVRDVKLKKGISGGKATAAILTGGLSILGTGLSRKEAATEATCSNCGSVWHF